MLSPATDPLKSLQDAYARGDVSTFAQFLRTVRVSGDEELAALIDFDARTRLESGLRVEFERYLEAVPAIANMPISLDAALEFSLRDSSRSNRPSAEAVESLARRYPHLEMAIRNAAALSHGLATTTNLHRMESQSKQRVLPSDFGPPMRDGRSRYRLQRMLGGGSQGDVYLASDEELSEPGSPAMVAIKILRNRPQADPDRWRAIEEATKARRVIHPGVVRVLDRGTSADDEDFIIYEYVDGGDLEARLQEGAKYSAAGSAKLVASIARGVQAAHSAQVVHCDLKPANVLLTADGQPKVADFGIAARLHPFDITQQRTDGLIGNLAFIAPEQFRGEENGSAVTADVYALGGLLFHLLTGRLPNGATPEEVAKTHAPETGRCEAPELKLRGSVVDRDLAAICRRALAPRVQDRYPTADALATDLEAWLEHLPISWTRPSLFRRAALLTRRQPRLVALAAIFTLAAVVSTVLWINARIAQAEQEIRLDYFQQRRDSVKEGLLKLRTRFGAGQIPDQWLPLITATESIMGPFLFEASKGDALWDDRIQLALSVINRANAEGHVDCIETLLWSDCLALWLLYTPGQGETAARVLDKFDPFWARRLSATDPWMEARRTLRTCAQVQVLDEVAEARTLTPSQIASLTELEHQLDIDMSRYTSPIERGSLRQLILATKVRLYGPRLLNNSAAQLAAIAESEKLRNRAAGLDAEP